MNPDDDDDKEYIYWDFKTYNFQKTEKKTALLLPQLDTAIKFMNTDTVPDFNFLIDQNQPDLSNHQINTCDDTASNKFELFYETGMCRDKTVTTAGEPFEWYNMCFELGYTTA